MTVSDGVIKRKIKEPKESGQPSVQGGMDFIRICGGLSFMGFLLL